MILALDITERVRALEVANQVSDLVDAIKVNYPIVLGCGMENPHTTDERIRLANLEKLAKLAVELAKGNG